MSLHPPAVLALDPGPKETGWVVYGRGRVLECDVSPNHELLGFIIEFRMRADALAIEMFSSFGMPVGREVFETVWWVGKFTQAWPRPDEVRLIYRADVKLALCGSARAKDANIRQALLDRVGPRGTKKAPGPTFGVSGHVWAALAVAVVAAQTMPPGSRVTERKALPLQDALLPPQASVEKKGSH